MAFRKRSNYRKKAGGRYKRRSYKRKSMSKKVFNKRVRVAMQRTAETKMADYFVNNKTLTTTASGDFENWNLKILNASSLATFGTYTISQGAQQGQRIGNSITTKKCILKGTISPNLLVQQTYNFKPRPLYVTLWIFKLKPHLNDDSTTVSTVVSNSFFQQGNTSVGFAGTLLDMQKTPNTNHVTILKKRVFKVGAAATLQVGTGVTGATTEPVLEQDMNNNDFAMSKMFSMDITKIMPKKQSFNDGTDNAVQRHLWLMYTVCAADGTSITTNVGAVTGPIPCYVSMGLEYRYTDL